MIVKDHLTFAGVCCFDNGYVGKQPVGRKEYCANYWLKKLKESMDRCTVSHNITEILLKNGIKHHTINKSSPTLGTLFCSDL